MQELPEWIQDRAEVKAGRKLQEPAVAEVFYTSNRPYLTRRQVQSALDGEVVRQTVLDRLDGLCEASVLRRDPEAGIYWLVNEKSDWPIPPDVSVEPTPDEKSVSEFFNQWHIKVISGGVGLNLLSSLLLWLGGFIGATGVESLATTGVAIVAVGLILIILGWAAIIYGAFLSLSNRGETQEQS